ncbi:hypothetical protein [Deinococcus ficus]|uniref:Uncharacterized protein n=1 Tax=Deinococcus ficus TaxID=317577 RepID=A0A221T3A0_9DEIO|nr:hypothetical protein [Deinococcus ficus]ASN83363.1 hypothetical protein DFI_19385 [Deinococcus ficus]
MSPHLNALHRAADTCNALLNPGGPAITLRTHGDEVHLARDGVHETFTLHGHQLQGRGGTFNILDPAQAHQAVLTVQPTDVTTDHDLTLLGLDAAALDLGATVRLAPTLRWKSACWMTPVHLHTPDGHTAWLALFRADYERGGLSLTAGAHWLAAYLSPLDEELRVLMACTDEENAEDLGAAPCPVPDHVTPARVRVHPEALLALLRGDAPAREHLVPADFHQRPEAYEDPSLTVTRAALQARRQHDQRQARRHSWTDAGGLAF